MTLTEWIDADWESRFEEHLWLDLTARFDAGVLTSAIAWYDTVGYPYLSDALRWCQKHHCWPMHEDDLWTWSRCHISSGWNNGLQPDLFDRLDSADDALASYQTLDAAIYDLSLALLRQSLTVQPEEQHDDPDGVADQP